MVRMLLLCIAAALCCAEPKYSADISYLVADLKYSRARGVKICEVQHGALSAVKGDLYVSGGDGVISPMIGDVLSAFPMKKWAAGMLYPPLKRSLESHEWGMQQSIRSLIKDPEFVRCAKQVPIDPRSIGSYSGMVYAALDIARHFEVYRKAYPGILFIDAVTLPYWKDKYKMNALFELDEELKRYKAEWRLYPKKYDPLLAERIQTEMPSEVYVIKPRRECLANGVIVVAKEDLDSVLQMILEPDASLEKHPDKKYAFWKKNREDTFLIEKYYPSDFLLCSHPLLEESLQESNYQYDATMRLAFIMQCDGEEITYHCLGGFWKLPSKALEEEGTLNEKRISCCETPFYRPVEPELFEEVSAQMERAMLLLYDLMLSAESL